MRTKKGGVTKATQEKMNKVIEILENSQPMTTTQIKRQIGFGGQELRWVLSRLGSNLIKVGKDGVKVRYKLADNIVQNDNINNNKIVKFFFSLTKERIAEFRC